MSMANMLTTLVLGLQWIFSATAEWLLLEIKAIPVVILLSMEFYWYRLRLFFHETFVIGQF